MRCRPLALLILAALVLAFAVDARVHAEAADGRHHEASCGHAAQPEPADGGDRARNAPSHDDSCPPCLLHSSDVARGSASQGVAAVEALTGAPVPTAPPRPVRLGYRERGPPAA